MPARNYYVGQAFSLTRTSKKVRLESLTYE
jgi:hypothetical protein